MPCGRHATSVNGADTVYQGDVYQKIIEEVVQASMNDFEESGVGQGTLNELQQVSSPSSPVLSYQSFATEEKDGGDMSTPSRHRKASSLPAAIWPSLLGSAASSWATLVGESRQTQAGSCGA